MTANASKSKDSEISMVSVVADKVSEAVLLIMQLYGIRKISCQKIRSCEFERMVAVTESFPGIPDDLKVCGTLIKDALAGILASAGIVDLEMIANEDDLKQMTNSYESMQKAYNSNFVIETSNSADNTVLNKNSKKDNGDSPDEGCNDGICTQQ